jgi:hypothetical protein
VGEPGDVEVDVPAVERHGLAVEDASRGGRDFLKRGHEAFRVWFKARRSGQVAKAMR